MCGHAISSKNIIPHLPARAGSRATVIFFSVAVLVACCGLNIRPAAAQSFAPKVDYPTGANSFPHAVAVGDFNGDSKPDLAVANQFYDNVGVFINNGNGTFAAGVYYAVSGDPASVAVGDFNGDGKPDLATVNFTVSSNTVSVLINNGNGTFAAKVDYTLGGNPTSVAAGDFNGDGKPDLAVTDSSNNALSVLINNGNGAFAAKVDYPTGSSPAFVAVGDFNGDAKPDLATANYGGNTISVLINNGNGTFATKVDYPTGANSQPLSIAGGDFNGDGKPDLATANFNNNTMSVFINNGEGTFAPKVDYPTGTNPWSVAAGDFNGDGKLDLALANYSSNTMSVFTGGAGGAFSPKVDYPTGANSNPISIAAGDFNADGKLDLTTANYNTGAVSVFINSASTTTCTPPPAGMVAWYPGDGNANDIEGGNNGTLGSQTAFAAGKVRQAFQFNTNNGSSATQVHVPDSPSLRLSNGLTIDAWINPTAPGVADNPILVKGDLSSGNSQPYSILFVNAGQNDNRIIFRVGNTSTFDSLVNTGPIPLNAYTHIAVTYDGTTMSIYINGTLDAFKTTTIGTLNQNTFPLTIGGGAADFNGAVDELEIFNRALSQSEIQAIVNADSAGKCQGSKKPTYDFDGDGKSDVSYWNPSNHNWYIQQSSTNTLRTQLDWGNGSLGDIAVPRDYDGDGKCDIAVFRPSEGNWYIIQSSTNIIRLVNWGSSSDKPVPADYDGDSKTDIAVFRPSEGNWYILNSATNTVTVRGWGISSDIPVPGFYDADGKADIAVYRASEGNWYIINSLSNTGRQVNWGSGSDQPVLADFDGDGRTDIAIFRPNERVWFINQSSGGVTVKHWGEMGDKLAPADYDGDGRADIAVFRTGGGGGEWWIIQSGTNTLANPRFGFGAAGDVPSPSTFIAQ
ncbi:MAG: hypothetical protein QOF02_1984 [Blastocatellia bacterium]|jgi:hypothetical protein|nr:hypothetical protein [Blastocatellia bacterium]